MRHCIGVETSWEGCKSSNLIASSSIRGLYSNRARAVVDEDISIEELCPLSSNDHFNAPHCRIDRISTRDPTYWTSQVKMNLLSDDRI
jgi:hypothetical protein